jgi:hypothetical protein
MEADTFEFAKIYKARLSRALWSTRELSNVRVVQRTWNRERRERGGTCPLFERDMDKALAAAASARANGLRVGPVRNADDDAPDARLRVPKMERDADTLAAGEVKYIVEMVRFQRMQLPAYQFRVTVTIDVPPDVVYAVGRMQVQHCSKITSDNAFCVSAGRLPI